MFDKEQPYQSIWQVWAAQIRGDKATKRQQLIRMLLIMFTVGCLGLVQFVHLIHQFRGVKLPN
jgi:hypothetical protein